MNTSVAVQKSVRNKAAKKAKKDGFPLSTVVKILLNDYAEGRIRIGAQIDNSKSDLEIINMPQDIQKEADKLMNSKALDDLINEA